MLRIVEKRKQYKAAISILDNELLRVEDNVELSAVQLMKSFFSSSTNGRKALRICLNPGVQLWMRKKMMLLASLPIAMQELAQWANLL